MRFDDATPGRLTLRDGDGADAAVLAEYVYAPTDAPIESPRPYALLLTRDGRAATAYRPDDHVWHKGLSLALPHVGHDNFWGGPTYLRGQGYTQLANNGAQVHRGFTSLEPARVDERLDWVTQAGAVILTEERTLTARSLDESAWALTWRSRLTNVSGEALAFGSPTSNGRENAGYAGIFWRGPSGFTGGEIIGPDGAAGDAARGAAAPWLAYVSPDGGVGVLMLDAGAGESPWFARSAEYAGLCPAPFFYDDTEVAPGDTLTLGVVVIIGGPDAATHATGAGAELVAELRADSEVPA
ncbi:PmoA family protein [Microbacterium sp. 2FI]|uniref:DUF6807 domain-containing protein n=1 Tax=Microbacterium sp. 2FI TaxID=2502193 RepID=UPI0010F4E2DA|nr:PmoA family protein [Microbacterium sp. 2FI]